ncbi:MAG: Ku protein [Tardiphaga sp.]|nr:Ku protein [Tardiphaga sp.]
MAALAGNWTRLATPLLFADRRGCRGRNSLRIGEHCRNDAVTNFNLATSKISHFQGAGGLLRCRILMRQGYWGQRTSKIRSPAIKKYRACFQSGGLNYGTSGKAKATARPGTNVVDLMTALQQSLKGGDAKVPAAKGKKLKVAASQREMLLPISGKRASAKEETKAPAKTSRASSKTRKAG